jgi:radical SAM superfamily enzyme YgiQ (UPF0313 family)
MDKPKILLTTPPLNKIVEPLYDKPSFVRYAIAALAAVLLKENVISELLCIDAKFSQFDENDLLKIIIDFKPDIIGISSFTYEIEDAGNLAEKIKSTLPQTIICVGGPHISAIPEQCMKEFTAFDIGFIGESEISLKEFCQKYINKDNYVNIRGICYRERDKIIVNPEREKIKNLDELPMPAWHLLPKAKEYFIQTSKGCPFNCNFCFNPNGNIVRQRSAENVIKEIEWLIENMQPKRISFGDEVFGSKNSNTEKILDLIIEKQIYKKVKWDIQTHVSFVNEELLKKLKKAKVSKIELGVESGNDEILKMMGKGIKKEKIIYAFNLCKKYKIKTGAFLIFGHPNETKESINESIKFACKLNPTEPIFALMVPFPGTKIYEYYKNQDYNYICRSTKWSEYRKQLNTVLQLKNISNKELRILLLKANVMLYLKNFRFLGLIKFGLSNYKSGIAFLKSFFLK